MRCSKHIRTLSTHIIHLVESAAVAVMSSLMNDDVWRWDSSPPIIWRSLLLLYIFRKICVSGSCSVRKAFTFFLCFLTFHIFITNSLCFHRRLLSNDSSALLFFPIVNVTLIIFGASQLDSGALMFVILWRLVARSSSCLHKIHVHYLTINEWQFRRPGEIHWGVCWRIPRVSTL